jgi:transposase-like protein
MASTKGKQAREAAARPLRWSANRKLEVVMRLLRGESLDAVSRETGLPASALSEWRDAFVETGRAGLKSRSLDPVAEAVEDERKRLLAKIGELSMTVEVLEAAKKVYEDKLGPSEPRRSKR